MPVFKKVNTRFFEKWSHDMAYITGFFCADGGLSKRKNGSVYVSFYSSDKPLLASFKKTMESEHCLSKRNMRSGSVYRIQICSSKMGQDLSGLGLGENKTRRMRVPMIPLKYQADFVRGFFDGDGNVWVGLNNTTRKKPSKTIQTTFTSSSLYFLEDLKRLLLCVGVVGGSLFRVRDKNCGRLTYSVKGSLNLYKFMYNGAADRLYLLRKKRIFEKYIHMQS